MPPPHSYAYEYVLMDDCVTRLTNMLAAMRPEQIAK